MFASLAAEAGIAVGLKGGLNSADQSWEPYEALPSPDVHHRWGALLAAHVEIPAFGWCTVNPSIGYSQKGSKWTLALASSGASQLIEESRRWDYLSIHVPIRAAVSHGDIRFYIGMGPRLDVLLASHRDVTITPPLGATPAEDALGPDLKNVVVGVITAVGQEIPLSGHVALIIEAVFDADVTPAWKDTAADAKISSPVSIRNRAGGFTTGVRLEL
jgi:hypothetical protein